MHAQEYIPLLHTFRVGQLRILAKIIYAPRVKRVKGGRCVRLLKAEQMRAVRRAVAHTHPSPLGQYRLERFAETAQGYLDQHAN